MIRPYRQVLELDVAVRAVVDKLQVPDNRRSHPRDEHTPFGQVPVELHGRVLGELEERAERFPVASEPLDGQRRPTHAVTINGSTGVTLLAPVSSSAVDASTREGLR